MPNLTTEISQSLLDAVDDLARRTGDSRSAIVSHALADALGVEHASLFQVSAADALVAGVTRGSITVAELTTHGDFGLGTFDDFDGELVVLDGTSYQVTKDGIAIADPDAKVPYAAVLNFRADETTELSAVGSFDDLLQALDALRGTDNDFFAVRIDGTFDHVKTRAVCKSEGDNLVDAAQAQAYFEFDDVTGTVAGVWSPEYTQSITVTGWHLHFLTDDHQGGGHVLSSYGSGLWAQVQRVANFHVAFPETVAFMQADLTIDRRKELDDAEADV
jgi:acetolactate decarboxylase